MSLGYNELITLYVSLGGHQLAVSYVDSIIDNELLPASEEEAELYKEMLILSGFINKYHCGVRGMFVMLPYCFG